MTQALPDRGTLRGAPQRRARVAVRECLIGGALLAAAVVVGLSLLAGDAPYRAVGDADPGAVVAVGTPVLRLAAEVFATVCVGSLAFAVFCTSPQPSGSISAEAYRELRIAAGSAACWGVTAALLVPFSAADTAGLPLATAIAPQHLPDLVVAMEPPKAWLLTAVAGLAVAAGCRAVLRWQSAVGLLGAALFALLPPLVTGHGSADLGHDLALGAVLVHVPAAVLWIGVLVAVLRHAGLGGAAVPELAARYSRLAGWCLLVLIVSGAVLSFVLAPPGLLFGSGYGALLLVKAVVVAALGVGGTALRGRALRGWATDHAGWRRLIRLGLAELVVLLAVLGISVELTHLPLPDVLGRAVTTTQTMLGYDLAGPPTLLPLLTDWRLDMVFGPLAVLLAAGYLVGVRRVHSDGRNWPTARTVAWLAGCVLLLVATSSGLGRYAAAMFSMHMASHMLTSMLVPALLVLGGPQALLRAAVPWAAPGRLPGPREWLETLNASRAARTLTHPVVAVALFAGSPFALYFTGLFDAAVRFHWAHTAITAWFLVVGYLFLWPVIGADPAPRPLPNLARLGMLLAAMPADLVFSVVVMNTDTVIGNGVAASNMYQALGLAWVPDLLADQRLAGAIALVLGELSLFVVLAALLARWNSVESAADGSAPGGYPAMLAAASRQGRGER